MNKIERIKELVKICNYHSDLYYIKDNPAISDKEYDKLYTELESLEKETGFILSSSPTQKVQGGVVSFLKKVKHTEPMLSADKSKDINDIKEFIGNKDTVLSWKLDGLTIVLRYDNGKFQQAVTRGGGTEGEDVTHTVSQFTNIPLTINYNGYIELRGEGLVLFDEFERINAKLVAKGEEEYKSPRNLAAGSVRQLDANITKQRNLILVAFGIVKCDTYFRYKTEQLQFLQSLGFETVYHHLINISVLNEAVKMFEENVSKLPYPTDGLVFEFNNIEYGKSLGSTGHHTRNMYALKWQDDSYETILRDVEYNTTRTGQINPTAIFDTVVIDNTEVSRASLHNISFIKDLNLNIGSRILVSKRNLIIPHIEENLDRDNGLLEIPEHCPTCGGKTEIRNTGTAEFLFCTNDDCQAKLLDKFVNFVKRDGMNIEGLSEATLEKFINKGWLKTFDDIYRLNEHCSEICKMNGFGVQSYHNLQSAIEKSKNIKLENFITALGIEGVGLSTAKLLAKKFKTVEKFIFANNAELLSIDGIGDITVDSICNYLFNNADIIDELNNIVSIVIEEKKEIAVSDNPFKGTKVYATGKFANYKKEEIKKVLESLGAEFASGYAKSLNYLIVGSIEGSSKEAKAKKDGIHIITEKEFMNMIMR
jgi:DNA ligase (NAD+)